MPTREETLAALRQRISAVEQDGTSTNSKKTAVSNRDAGMPEHSGVSAEETLEEDGSSKKGRKAQDDGKPQDLGPETAFSRAVALISAAPRTSRDVADRLKREGFPASSISSAIDRATACGLLDDAVYAEQYTLTRLSRGYGLHRISEELHRKDIPVETLEFWRNLKEERDAEAEFEAALAFARAKTFSSKHPDKALFAALVRRGYSTSCAYRVVRSVNDAD